MKKMTFLSFAVILFAPSAYSQGCIVVRNISGFGQYNLTDKSFTSSKWRLNVTSRYFKAFRDFRGTEDTHTPKVDRTYIKSFSTDFTLSMLLNNGWSFDLSLPFSANSRSATKEHGGAGTPRHVTHAYGLGDIRATLYKWLLRPAVTQRGNIQLGVGIKLPSGDYKYTDYFYRNDTTKVIAPVNLSIQLGDGGTGIITELNTYYFINTTQTISIYGNFYYLMNPRDQNGVSTTTGNTPTPLQVKSGNDVMSVPDIYSIRVGFNFDFKKIALSAGLRDEGEPVDDLLGGNYGVRRPGHNLSAEPGILFKLKKVSLYGYLPVMISRKIKRSEPDEIVTRITGVPTTGTGGSGNYGIFLGAQFKL